MGTETSKQTCIGVALYILKDETHLLLHKRFGSHGTYTYATTGGHMEYMESFSQAALRELAEECGPDIKVTKPKFLCLINLTDYAPKHYVHISMVAQWKSGEPKLMEPDKGKGWQWYPINALPSPLFKSTQQSLEALETGKHFFE